jgi:hypothetical protein
VRQRGKQSYKSFKQKSMELVPIIIVPTVMYFTYKFLESLIRRKERMMIIEKLEFSNLQTLPLEANLNVLDYMPNKRFSSLRTGVLIAGIGLGLIVAWVLAITLYPTLASNGDKYRMYRDMFNTIYLAAPALFGGIGLIVSYVIERKQKM